MTTCVHLWQYVAEFISEWETFQTKVAQKIKTHILCSMTFFWKSCRLWDNVEKHGTAGQATDDNTVRRMRFACWIINATITHPEYVIFIAFPLQQQFRARASMLSYAYFAWAAHLSTLLLPILHLCCLTALSGTYVYLQTFLTSYISHGLCFPPGFYNTPRLHHPLLSLVLKVD
jgi:hypothetical protein